jgi:hypothetical protein
MLSHDLIKIFAATLLGLLPAECANAQDASAATVVHSAQSAFADCSVAILKTYMPKRPGKKVCDDHGLPAQFAGNLSDLSSGLASRGYSAIQFDQCSTPVSEVQQKYTLVSQLGDCNQSGATLTCSLYVALLNSQTSETDYTKTIGTTDTGSVTLHLSDALEDLPACADLK